MAYSPRFLEQRRISAIPSKLHKLCRFQKIQSLGAKWSTLFILIQIELNANKKSYEERIIEKFGMPELYDEFDKQYEVLKEPPIFKYARSFFLEKGQKLDKEG